MTPAPPHDPWLGEMFRTWALAGAAQAVVNFDRTLHALLALAAVVSAVVGLWRFAWEWSDRRERQADKRLARTAIADAKVGRDEADVLELADRQLDREDRQLAREAIADAKDAAAVPPAAGLILPTETEPRL